MKAAQTATLVGFVLACLLAVLGVPAAVAWFVLIALAGWAAIAVIVGVAVLLGIAVG
jgi:hypothetical protein